MQESLWAPSLEYSRPATWVVQLPQLNEARDNCLLEYWGSVVIMENKMETTMMDYIGVI